MEPHLAIAVGSGFLAGFLGDVGHQHGAARGRGLAAPDLFRRAAAQPERSEMPGKGELFVLGQLLAAKHQRDMPIEGVVQKGNDFVGERPGNIQPRHGGTDMGRQGLDREPRHVDQSVHSVYLCLNFPLTIRTDIFRAPVRCLITRRKIPKKSSKLTEIGRLGINLL